jgi:hypothetical protein
MRTRVRNSLLAAALCAGTAGCGSNQADLRDALREEAAESAEAQLPPAAAASSDTLTPADTLPQTPDTARDGRDWTVGVVDRPRAALPPSTVRGVRSARNDGFDRVVWEFAGDAVPGYHVEYVDRPVRRCGSGAVAEIAGLGWLQVRLEPARGHDAAGASTLPAPERSARPDLPVIRQLEQTCDFEAVAEWTLGVATPNRFRVLELRQPARLVVDVRH